MVGISKLIINATNKSNRADSNKNMKKNNKVKKNH